jgi:intracellular septation protein
MVSRTPEGKARCHRGRLLNEIRAKQKAKPMRDVFVRLGSDFLSTLLFLALYLTTGSLALATFVAIAGAVAQLIHARIKGEALNFMAYASLALVIVLGSATLLTNDPRFVLAKPSIAHFAIGAIMLKRGWMLRYICRRSSPRPFRNM